MRSKIGTSLAVALAVGGISGCGEVDSTGFLSINSLSSFEVDDGGCSIEKELQPPLWYDAGVGAHGTDYLIGVWLANTLVPNGDDTNNGKSEGRINTNRIHVSHFVVEFPDRERWGFLPEEIEVGLPVVLESNSVLGHSTRLIPSWIARVMIEHPDSPIAPEGSVDRLPIRFRAEGKLLDGDEVESNVAEVTLTVANGLLGGGCGSGYKVVGACSFAQPDTYECEEDKESQ